MTDRSAWHFDEHLIIEGYGGAFARLNSRKLVASCLHAPRTLAMTLLAEPKVFWTEANGKKDPAGWSGFVVITYLVDIFRLAEVEMNFITRAPFTSSPV